MKFPLKIKHFKTFHVPVCGVHTQVSVRMYVCTEITHVDVVGCPQQSAFYLTKQHLFLNLELSCPASCPSQHAFDSAPQYWNQGGMSCFSPFYFHSGDLNSSSHSYMAFFLNMPYFYPIRLFLNKNYVCKQDA